VRIFTFAHPPWKGAYKVWLKFSFCLTLAQFSLLTPYPGTEEFERAKEDDLLLTEDWSKYTGLEPVVKVPGMAKKS